MRTAPPAPATRALRAYRDDGPASRALGRMAGGRLPPLPASVLAVALVSVLSALRPDGGPAPALFAPVVVLLLTGPSATHPHTGRLDWLAPPILRGIEYGYLAVLGFAQAISAPLVYVLIAVLALHHYDTMCRVRRGPGRRSGSSWPGSAGRAGRCLSPSRACPGSSRSRTRRWPPTLACCSAARASSRGRGVAEV